MNNLQISHERQKYWDAWLQLMRTKNSIPLVLIHAHISPQIMYIVPNNEAIASRDDVIKMLEDAIRGLKEDNKGLILTQ